jgi:hypothetical protein
MLALDSLVTDLIFASQPIGQEALQAALAGKDQDPSFTLLDPDRLDPRVEMELSPSMPFRRRGERRLLMVDGSVAPMRKEPDEPLVPLDLRPAKDALIALCEALPIKLGRLFALGSWGDAVLVARSARDLRGICLIPWALDPLVDVDGKRRAAQLSQPEFEAKILAFDKRLDELDEKEILGRIQGATFERRGDLLSVDVLEPDGTWDLRKSLVLEAQLAAMDRFSLIPGAPSAPPAPAAPARSAAATRPAAAAATRPAEARPAPAPAGPPLAVHEIEGTVVLMFPAERFDLDVAAALGKRDWDAVVRSSDKMPGVLRDRLHRDGGAWVAPLEFLSEVFVDGKPLSRPFFDDNARPVREGVRALDVHFPRFGPAVLLDVPGLGRYVTSLVDHPGRIADLVRG